MTATPNCDTGPLEFMATLSLLPPYSLDDVKSAYRAKVLKTHPDRGGSTHEFLKIQEAYERAVEYVEHCGDRRKWIADHIDSYRRQWEVAAAVERLGGQVVFEEVDWLAQSVGDFAVLVERLRVIRLRDTAADDAFLMFLAEEPPRTPYLFELDLAGTRITDKGLHARSEPTEPPPSRLDPTVPHEGHEARGSCRPGGLADAGKSSAGRHRHRMVFALAAERLGAHAQN